MSRARLSWKSADRFNLAIFQLPAARHLPLACSNLI
jgi:hypothetical protein